MRLTNDIYVVGSGWAGCNITNFYDCDVFLIDCGNNDLILIDTGAGIETQRIIENITKLNFDIKNIRYILITHAHGDHAGGLYELKTLSGATALAHPDSAKYISEGNLHAMSLDVAIRAGGYPKDYKFLKCKVDTIKDGESLKVGNVCITAIDTPGHCSGHNAYLMRSNHSNALFSGDSIFLGGKISLQNIWDCCIQDYAVTANKLCNIDFQSLIPSHFGVDINNGHRHIEKAVEIFSTLGVPENAAEGRI